MALRNIRHHPEDDVLKKVSREVDRIDDRIRALLADMTEMMHAANGAGLAAVQVGILKRVVIIADGSGLLRLINPVIVEASGEQQELEGCLSIPGIYGKVKRPERVVVRAMDEYGAKIELVGNGLLARAFCHEIDHLDGILFIEKVIPRTIINLASTDVRLGIL